MGNSSGLKLSTVNEHFSLPEKIPLQVYNSTHLFAIFQQRLLEVIFMELETIAINTDFFWPVSGPQDLLLQCIKRKETGSYLILWHVFKLLNYCICISTMTQSRAYCIVLSSPDGWMLRVLGSRLEAFNVLSAKASTFLNMASWTCIVQSNHIIINHIPEVQISSVWPSSFFIAKCVKKRDQFFKSSYLTVRHDVFKLFHIQSPSYAYVVSRKNGCALSWMNLTLTRNLTPLVCLDPRTRSYLMARFQINMYSSISGMSNWEGNVRYEHSINHSLIPAMTSSVRKVRPHPRARQKQSFFYRATWARYKWFRLGDWFWWSSW